MDSEFDAEAFEKKLTTLKDTQDGIQQMSSWCLQRRNHHKKIVSCWLNVLKQVRVEHRLILFYLANDVIQNSKRKHYEFVDSWVTALQKATTMVRDEKVRDKIYRIFNIWLQRDIYSEEYLSDLKGLLNIKKHNNIASHSKSQVQSNLDRTNSQSYQHENNISKSDTGSEFQSTVLIKKITDCVKFGAETDRTFKKLPRSNKSYLESIKSNMIKDKSHSEDVEKDIEQYVITLEAYIKSLKTEIKSRHSLIKNIEEGKDFFGNQREEVKVVVNAYKNFGLRIKAVKKKLDEVIPNLPSPIPSPDINAPSPEPDDADIALPDDDTNTLNLNLLSAAGSTSYISYMDGKLPFDINDFQSESSGNKHKTLRQSDINAQAIEVISTRKEENSQRVNYELNNFNSPISKLYSNDYNQTLSFNQQSAFGMNVPQPSNLSKSLIPPPPIPPMLNDHGLDFSVDWNAPWNPANNSFNNIDTPVSPPQFEKEGNNLRVDYDEDLENLNIFTEDIDNRNIPMLQKDKNRLTDVDHRNLISLTGSPGIHNPKPDDFSNSFLNDTDELFQPKDIDYRAQGFNTNKNSELNIIPLKPPSSLIEIEQTCAESELPINLLSQNDPTFLNPTNYCGKRDDGGGGGSDIICNTDKDNTESVDMDVSDDDIENYINAKPNIQKELHRNQDERVDSNDEHDFHLQFNNDLDPQGDLQLEENEVNNTSWNNNWKQHKMNPRMSFSPHMSQKQRFNSPRYRGNGGGTPRSQNFQNKFHNNPIVNAKSHRGSPFYFNRGGISGSVQRGSMQQRGGTILGYQRGNFRGRPW